MGFLKILLLSFGALGLALASECIPETAKCSQLWQKIEPHKGLMETEKYLNEWCRKQSQFYECLEDVLLAGKDGNVSYLPTNLLISKLFAEDLCSEGSTSRRKYLNNAACINQLNTEYCTQSEYLDIVLPDDAISPSTCSLAEKTFSCIAATVILHCGFDAGRVYRNLLKITRYSDEVCNIEFSHGIPRCEQAVETKASTGGEKQLSEIYYGLVHRIGSIPEQDVNTGPSIASNEADISEENENYEIITEAISSALDSLDENSSSEDIAENDSDETDNSMSLDIESPEQLVQSFKSYLKHPVITQIYRDLLFYNYSGAEYAFYWRQPEFTIFENVTCEHLRSDFVSATLFRCIFEYRDRDPDCTSKESVDESVTPELIIDIDPDVPDESTTEFGPSPHWMKSVDDGMEANKLRELKSTSESTVDSETDFQTIVSAAFIFLNVADAIKESPEWKWMDVRKNSAHILPDDLMHELMSIFMPEPEEYYPSPISVFQIANKSYTLIYDPETNAIENMTCSRINECHPRGRGLFKCHAFHSKVETCDECYDATEAYVEGLPATSQSDSNANPKYKILENADATQIPENSDASESTTLEELVTFVLNDDSETGKFDPFFERFNPPIGDVDESSYLSDASSDADDANTKNSDSDLPFRLMVLEQDPNEQLEASSYASELVYAVDGMKIFDDEQVSDLNLSDTNYGLLNENVIILQDVSDTSNVEATYAIVNTSGDGSN